MPSDHSTATVGSLCTGIGGLEHALTLAGIDHRLAFVADIDPGACEWLAANRPDAPNLGNFTTLEELPPVDLLTAGFPCQPLSTAGNRAGLNDERWLFDDIADLVGRMEPRPDLFLENVPGLLTANGGDAMARVVHRLAAIGYVFTWGTLAASAVGAPHRRLRWFGLARHGETAHADGVGRLIGTRPGESEPTGLGRHGPRHDDRATAPDPDGAGSETRFDSGPDGERIRLQPVGPTPSAPDPDGNGPHRQADPTRRGEPDDRRGIPTDERDRKTQVWGNYWPAIARWEHVMGRTAPDPTHDGRLNAPFVEWMMGYPAGWVCDTLTNRRHALHALGNAVVPQCGAAALTQLADRLNESIGVAA